MSEERLEDRLGYRPPTPSERKEAAQFHGVAPETGGQILVAVDPAVQARFDRTMRKVFLVKSKATSPERSKADR